MPTCEHQTWLWLEYGLKHRDSERDPPAPMNGVSGTVESKVAEALVSTDRTSPCGHDKCSDTPTSNNMLDLNHPSRCIVQLVVKDTLISRSGTY